MEDRLSESAEGPRRIKVVDRRRFDDSGELRPDAPPTVTTSPRSAAPAATPAVRENPSTAVTSPHFLDLVAGLAQQAELLITGAQGLPAQPAEAQQVIEILGMLESKTKGNLSGEEKQVLSNVIYQLRTLFLQRSR
ncbi:MAG: DUF1844 domain-containing protein [Thermoanaerobaculales bacterium]|nr:DUF1844 domain-containing protein [Thermoanaerobaculales bacterium]